MTKPTPSFGSFTVVSPNGVSCGTVNQFVVIADADNIYNVRWCAIGDPTDWPTPATDDARSKQAGQQTLPSQFGRVTGIAGNDFFGYVFQERAVTKMTYVGGDVVFAFDTFEEGRGCWELNRYAQVDDTVFYESEFDYHSLTDGQIVDIGFGKIARTYPPTKPASNAQQNVVINKAINTVFFESQNLAFNYKTGQWTRQPAWDGFVYFPIDSATGQVGRVENLGGGGVFLFGDQSGGTVPAATMRTGEFEPHPDGGMAIVDSIRPINNGGTLTSVNLKVRNLLSDSQTTVTGTALNSRTREVHFRGGANRPTGRWMDATFAYSGTFTSIRGAEVRVMMAGMV